MKTPEYTILWVDDEYETLKSVIARAKSYGLKLVPFRSVEAGLRELKAHYRTYDGVIFDARVYEKESDVGQPANTKASIDGKYLLKEQIPKDFDIFILTGQSKVYGDDTFKLVFPNIYEKGVNQTIKLFEDMRAYCAARPERLLRSEHKKAFEACTDTCIGAQTADDLLYLLKMNEAEFFSGGWNVMRKIVEDIFRAMAREKIIPMDFVRPSTKIVPTSKFLAKKNNIGPINQYSYTGVEVPGPILMILEHLTKMTNMGSHRSDLDIYYKSVEAPYLKPGLVNQLMELMVWFKKFLEIKHKDNCWEINEYRGR